MTSKFPRTHNDDFDDDIRAPLKKKGRSMMMNDLEGQKNMTLKNRE